MAGAFITGKIAQAIILAANIMARKCDGASTIDGMGFNKMDAEFGHNFVTRRQHSAKEMNAMRNVLRKYKRQIPEDLYVTIYGAQVIPMKEAK